MLHRTEESDVHCVLFDECLVEYHAAKGGTYGRCFTTLSTCEDSLDTEDELYSLLVDQFAHNQEDNNALEAYMLSSNQNQTTLNNQSYSVIGSEADTSFTGALFPSAITSIAPTATTSTVNTTPSLDTSIEENSSFLSQKKHDIIITTPSREFLPPNTSRFVYCIDGFPCFPTAFQTELFFPKEPDELSNANIEDTPVVPVLTRSDGELEEASRRRKIASANYGCQSSNQRRCLWQLPKLMASHVLGTWLVSFIGTLVIYLFL